MVADAGSAGFASDDVDSFGAWLEPLLPMGYRLALGMLRNRDDAEDAVQEAAAKAWRRRSSFRPEADPRPWFLAIVANECKMARRKSWLAERWFRAAAAREVEAPAESDEVDQVRQGLSRLGSSARLALVLRFYLDLSYDDVGRTLGVTAAAARVRVHRALAKLRVDVGEESRDG
jgi:RNA polymerase sigma-70 factor (ECF subfamily)